jgi:hypothetical protein
MNIFSYRCVLNEYITKVPTAAREKPAHFTYNSKMFLGAFAKLRKAIFDQVVPCGLTNTTKLAVAFRNVGNASKTVQYCRQSKVK